MVGCAEAGALLRLSCSSPAQSALKKRLSAPYPLCHACARARRAVVPAASPLLSPAASMSAAARRFRGPLHSPAACLTCPTCCMHCTCCAQAGPPPACSPSTPRRSRAPAQPKSRARTRLTMCCGRARRQRSTEVGGARSTPGGVVHSTSGGRGRCGGECALGGARPGSSEEAAHSAAALPAPCTLQQAPSSPAHTQHAARSTAGAHMALQEGRLTAAALPPGLQLWAAQWWRRACRASTRLSFATGRCGLRSPSGVLFHSLGK